ncbi:MAG TPA: TetR/AcrR family transcriptional regulator [Pseudonocardia sp.]|jgi:AcrR family transcriptional regulator
MAAKGGGSPDLPVVGQPPAERADAARSRRILLAAAREMMAECGVRALTMDGLAARAGVGVGTVYRRFTDRGGLALALLDSEEQRFQSDFIFGPPPLGPGAPPLERVRAFLCAYLDRLEVEADLHAFAEAQNRESRFRAGVYRTHRAHLAGLLTQADVGMDPAYLADVLLGVVSGELFLHHNRERRLSPAQLKANVGQVVDRLTSPCR